MAGITKADHKAVYSKEEGRLVVVGGVYLCACYVYIHVYQVRERKDALRVDAYVIHVSHWDMY